ncbi:MAG: hypothetical protein K9M94_07825 [Spirochaetia bacterium]|nr:hypothetical protein [Spirochaetia bacterium]
MSGLTHDLISAPPVISIVSTVCFCAFLMISSMVSHDIIADLSGPVWW